MEMILNQYVNSMRFKEALNIGPKDDVVLTPLARGEYNINYTFIHPSSGKKQVLRLNTASQMHLDNQIEYEYKALRLLEACGRTPRVFYADGKKDLLPYGVLVMEYLEGRSLAYETDMKKAAAVFADIHGMDASKGHFLIKPENPLKTMLEECKAMANVYLSRETGCKDVKATIERLIEKVESRLETADLRDSRACIINTEVNSGNFIINEDISRCYLVDWEKPLLGEAAQDLAHFLAPTTTFWRTDVILTQEEQEDFLQEYTADMKGQYPYDEISERVALYLPLNCLRGVTWCAMAWVEYNSESKLIRNEYTYEKIKAYLSKDYLDMVEERYFR